MRVCCVCGMPASYEVRLYDFYSDTGRRGLTFNEQDYTCPYLCEEHKQENESRAVGIRKPRGYVQYPYSNKYGAQGYTKYRQL